MRRFWIGVAGTIALAGLVAGPGVAYAGTTGAAKTASSCPDLIKKYQKANQATSSVDFSNPKSVSKLFKQGAQTFKGLAKNGPSQLRASFRRLAAAFDKLSKLDFSNANSLSQLTTLGATYTRDLAEIGTYFATQCNFKLPTVTVPTS